MHPTENYWPVVVTYILQEYFINLTTTCILRHPLFDDILQPSINSNVYLHINSIDLEASFSRDVHNFTKQDKHFNDNQVFYSDLVKKYTAAIKNSNCEGFVAFQEDIPLFAHTFRKASLYSIWRSTYSRFLFVYFKKNGSEAYFQDTLFRNQANILVVEADSLNSVSFSIKTNKFVGPLHEHPEQLILLSTFNALNHSLSPKVDLFPNNKLVDLKGRELVIAAFDYRPFVVVDFNGSPQYHDWSDDNPTHLVHVDGVETRIAHTFCELYNCSIQFDTSEKGEWGTSYNNYTGDGLMGMIINGKADLATGAMFAWSADYMAVDITNCLGRSGITCLVPTPTRLVSWNLPIRPFKITLWLSIFVILIMEVISLLLFRHFEQYLKNPLDLNSWQSNFVFGFITSLKLFVSQGTDYIVKANALRVMLFACYVLDIIITSVYGGGLSAILTLPIFEEAADSVERLYKHNLIWVATSYVWVESIIDVDDEPLYQSITNNFKTFKFEKIREMAKTENMAFALERLAYNHFGNLNFITSESLQRLKLMVDDIYYAHTVAMVSRLWALLPKYNDLIWNWRSSGFDMLWEWKITAEYLNINEQNQVQASKYYNLDYGPVELGMDNFGGIILVWLLGIIISIVVFMGEVLLYRIGITQ